MVDVVLASDAAKRLRTGLDVDLPDHIAGFAVFEAEVTKVEEKDGPMAKFGKVTSYGLKDLKLVKSNKGHPEGFETSITEYDCGPRGPVDGVGVGSKVLFGVYKYKSEQKDNATGLVKLSDPPEESEPTVEGEHERGLLGSAGNLIPGQTRPFPSRWGEPPMMQTRDFVVWPEGYGQGSGTVARWIAENLHEDSPLGSAGNMIPGQTKPFPSHWGEPPLMQTRDFCPWPEDYGQGSGTVGRWILEHLEQDATKSGSAKALIPGQKKPFPSHWGEPPLKQTKDMRPWPEDYGQGSGTVAAWIESNLKRDAAPRGSADNMIPGQTKAFPAHWGEPPAMQTRDFREWRGGYGQGSGTIATWIQEHMTQDSLKPGQVKPFPAHWGEPPKIQTRDFREFPGGYGQGSGTWATWIQKNMDADASLIPGQKKPFPSHWGEPPKMQTKDYREWPEGYGAGSGTVAKWIEDKLKLDAAPALLPATWTQENVDADDAAPALLPATRNEKNMGADASLIPGQKKPFPAHWGAPPMLATMDMVIWPEGYGNGSGSIAKWIRSNLDKDAGPRGSAGNLIPGQTKPFPSHWGEPPEKQTRDFGEWPEGYGQGSGSVATWIELHIEADKKSSSTPVKLFYSHTGVASGNYMPPTYFAVTFNCPSALSGSSPAGKMPVDHLQYPLNFYMSFKAELHDKHDTVEQFRESLNYFYSMVEDPYAPQMPTAGGCMPPGMMRVPRLKSGNMCNRAPEAMGLIQFDSWDGEVLKGRVKDPADKLSDAETDLDIEFTLRIDF